MKVKFLLENGYKLYCGTKEALVGTGWQIVTSLGSDELFLKSSQRTNNVNTGADTYPITSVSTFEDYNTDTSSYVLANDSHLHASANQTNTISSSVSTAATVANSSHSHTPNTANVNTIFNATTSWANLKLDKYNTVTAREGNNNYRIGNENVINFVRNTSTWDNSVTFSTSATGSHNHAAVDLGRAAVDNSKYGTDDNHSHVIGGSWDTTTRPAAIKLWLIKYVGV